MDEYISKEKAIKELREVYENEYPTASGDFDEYASHDVPNVLRNIPSAGVQPVKRGHWKDIMMSEATGWDLSLTGGRDAVCETVCSVCGNCCAFGGDGDLYLSPYCPNCGARMDLKDGDTDA